MSVTQGTSRVLDVPGILLLLLFTTFAPKSSAQITFTTVPPYGDTVTPLQGLEVGFPPADYEVSVLIFVEGLGWYSKPFCDSTLTYAEPVPLNSDGSWSTPIVTGGADQTAIRIAAFLVPAGTQVACTLAAGGLSPQLFSLSASHIIVDRPNPSARIIDFSGYKWQVKANSVPLGPGPCLFSDSPGSVSVDGSGFLHLRITNSNGNWYCAEIYSQRVFRYGLYSFYLGSDVSNLDPNVDLGLFTWDDTDANFSNREVDIEASRFGNASDSTNAQFVVQPFNEPNHLLRFTIPSGPSSVQSFDWRPGSVLFRSYNSEGQIAQQWLDTSGIPPSGTTNARLNFWIYNQTPPAAESEVVVQNFTFTPYYVDFDGDGRDDYAIWRPGSGTWYILPTSNPSQPQVQQWGLPGDIPVPGDYDGDGKMDFAVWRPSDGSWYIMTTANPPQQMVQQWGLPGDIPVPGDYDSDGITDYAVWRPSTGTWYIIPSTDPTHPIDRQWGLPGDMPVPGDYDGDGETDLAVWRPSDGVWYVIPSSNPSEPIIQQWGLPGDIPVPNDYDNDLKTDFAVWRPSIGTWYVLPSSPPQSQTIQQWGLTSDIPVYSPPGLIPSLFGLQ